MLKVITGIVAFVLVALLAWFVVYPFVFNGVSGLFENNDLGTILALAACVVVSIPLLWLAIAITVAGVFVGVAGESKIDHRNRQRRLAQQNDRYFKR